MALIQKWHLWELEAAFLKQLHSAEASSGSGPLSSPAAAEVTLSSERPRSGSVDRGAHAALRASRHAASHGYREAEHVSAAVRQARSWGLGASTFSEVTHLRAWLLVQPALSEDAGVRAPRCHRTKPPGAGGAAPCPGPSVCLTRGQVLRRF